MLNSNISMSNKRELIDEESNYAGHADPQHNEDE